jgi:hypothetical protein
LPLYHPPYNPDTLISLNKPSPLHHNTHIAFLSLHIFMHGIVSLDTVQVDTESGHHPNC